MISKKYPGSVVLALAVVACSGWVFGLMKGGGNGSTGETNDGSGPGSTKSSNRMDGRAREAAPGVLDPVTARLLDSLAEIKAAAVPGQVNKALVNACRGALMDSNTRRRDRDYGILLDLMRPEDAPALQALFLELHAQGQTFTEYGDFAIRWGEIDAEGALEFLQNEKFYWMPPRNYSAFARGWGVTDPQAAMKWIDEHPETAGSMGGHIAVLEGWVREDPASALKWLDQQRSKLSPEEYINASGVAFLEQVQGPNAGLNQAVSWLASLPEDGINGAAARHAWSKNMWCLGELNYETAADVWRQVGDESWMGFGEFRNFSQAIGRTRTAVTGEEGFLKALETTWAPEKVSDRFSEWTTQNPEATSQWLANAPDTPVTRSAIQGMIRSLEQIDPQAAKQWTEKLKDP
ncbi:MAG: hypothetical protein V4689_20140 [Verrucomicrobiota bacterium]